MYRVTALVLVCVLAGVLGDHGYGPPPPPPCYPKTVYETVYKDHVKEVPVAHTVFNTKLEPTTVYQADYSTLYSVIVKPQYLPQVVTTTKHVNQVQPVTKQDVIYQTNTETKLVTRQELVPTYVTETIYDTIAQTHYDLQKVYKTQTVPQYVTTTQVIYSTIYEPQPVPVYQTVYSTFYNYQTVCPPKPQPGYN